MNITCDTSMDDVHGHGDDPEATQPCWACRSMEGTPDWSRKDAAIILYPVAAGHCNYVSCLPHYLESVQRSDDMPAYTRSDHIEGSVQWCLERHDTRTDMQPWYQDQILHWHYSAASRHGEILVSSSSSDSRVRADKGNATLGSRWHQVPRGHQQASWKEGVKNITGVINNQIIHPLKCEEQERVNIWTGQKLNLQTWRGPVEKEWGRPWLQQGKQAVRK